MFYLCINNYSKLTIKIIYLIKLFIIAKKKLKLKLINSKF